MFEIFYKTNGLTKQQLDMHLPQMDILHSKFIKRMATQFTGECSALTCVCLSHSHLCHTLRKFSNGSLSKCSSFCVSDFHLIIFQMMNNLGKFFSAILLYVRYKLYVYIITHAFIHASVINGQAVKI